MPISEAALLMIPYHGNLAKKQGIDYISVVQSTLNLSAGEALRPFISQVFGAGIQNAPAYMDVVVDEGHAKLCVVFEEGLRYCVLHSDLLTKGTKRARVEVSREEDDEMT